MLRDETRSKLLGWEENIAHVNFGDQTPSAGPFKEREHLFTLLYQLILQDGDVNGSLQIEDEMGEAVATLFTCLQSVQKCIAVSTLDTERFICKVENDTIGNLYSLRSDTVATKRWELYSDGACIPTAALIPDLHVGQTLNEVQALTSEVLSQDVGRFVVYAAAPQNE